MRKKEKIKIMTLMICTLVLLVACFPIHSRIVPDLVIDSELNEFVEMQVDVLLEEQVVIITVNNNSDFEINLGSQNPGRIRRPSFQYFDGEDWRTVSYTSHIRPLDIDEFGGLENEIYPGEERQINFNFDDYHLPEDSLFRIVLTARGTDPARGYGVNAQFRHDFFAEFTLE